MKKLFGTDGIRAVAGQPPLDPATVHAIGLALAATLAPSPRILLGQDTRESSNQIAIAPKPRLLIGMDTRESSTGLAATLAQALTLGGAHVESAGVITTPAVAFLTATQGFSAGIVISASHNPWQDNGIKLFGPDGYKLPDATELGIEAEIFRQLETATDTPTTWAAQPPKVNEHHRLTYIQHLLAQVPNLTLASQRIVLDCANGAASTIAPQLFAELNARAGGQAILTHASPTGRNINEQCGALHPEVVAAEVLAHHATLGITFDGDADRALFADAHGNVVNGDAVLLLAARNLQSRNLLPNATIVATTMSNMGLEAALKRSGIAMLRAPVGDKYVLEQMLSTGATLGGEQSGHIIFAGRSTTGDGLLTALLLLDILHDPETGTPHPLHTLLADLKTYPQVIVNIKVREKPPLASIPTIAAAIHAAEAALADTGRVVIRYSGTEPLARVMIEAESHDLMHHHANAIAQAIRNELAT